jgi:hypothetical protein
MAYLNPAEDGFELYQGIEIYPAITALKIPRSFTKSCLMNLLCATKINLAS